MDTTASGYMNVTFDCPYRNVCTDNGVKCGSCRHELKRSYFEPIPIPDYPVSYHPFYPLYPTTVTYTNPSGTLTTASNHYEEK